MRTISLILMLVLLVALGILAYENNRTTTLNAFQWSWDLPFPAVIAGSYLLGMLTGWSLVAWMRRSWDRVTEYRHA